MFTPTNHGDFLRYGLIIPQPTHFNYSRSGYGSSFTSYSKTGPLGNLNLDAYSPIVGTQQLASIIDHALRRGMVVAQPQVMSCMTNAQYLAAHVLVDNETGISHHLVNPLFLPVTIIATEFSRLLGIHITAAWNVTNSGVRIEGTNVQGRRPDWVLHIFYVETVPVRCFATVELKTPESVPDETLINIFLAFHRPGTRFSIQLDRNDRPRFRYSINGVVHPFFLDSREERPFIQIIAQMASKNTSVGGLFNFNLMIFVVMDRPPREDTMSLQFFVTHPVRRQGGFYPIYGVPPPVNDNHPIASPTGMLLSITLREIMPWLPPRWWEDQQAQTFSVLGAGGGGGYGQGGSGHGGHPAPYRQNANSDNAASAGGLDAYLGGQVSESSSSRSSVAVPGAPMIPAPPTLEKEAPAIVLTQLKTEHSAPALHFRGTTQMSTNLSSAPLRSGEQSLAFDNTETDTIADLGKEVTSDARIYRPSPRSAMMTCKIQDESHLSIPDSVTSPVSQSVTQIAVRVLTHPTALQQHQQWIKVHIDSGLHHDGVGRAIHIIEDFRMPFVRLLPHLSNDTWTLSDATLASHAHPSTPPPQTGATLAKPYATPESIDGSPSSKEGNVCRPDSETSLTEATPASSAATTTTPPPSPSLNTINPVASPSSFFPPGTSFRLTRHLGMGSLWDVYAATITLPPPDLTSCVPVPAPVTDAEPPATSSISFVIKLAIAAADFIDDPNTDYDDLSSAEIEDSVVTETKLYSFPLATLQDKVVPRFHGVYRSRQVSRTGMPVDVWAMVLQDAGDRVTLASLGEEDKQQILAHYAALHNANVLHNDIAPRNWLRARIAKAGSIRIVDFDHAVWMDPSEPHWADEAKRESEKDYERQIVAAALRGQFRLED